MSPLRMLYLALAVWGTIHPMYYFVTWFNAEGWSLSAMVDAWHANAAASGLVTVGLTLLLIAGFIAALRPLGFPIATAIYLFLQFLVLTPKSATRSVPLYAGLAIASSVLIFATFRYAFDLLLPAGPLVAWLN